jgi:ankyrin repeat protein
MAWTPAAVLAVVNHAFRGDVHEVEVALRAGFPVSAAESAGGFTLLHALAGQAGNGCQLAVAGLLRRGASPNARDATGKTPLFYAIANGDLEVVRGLLAAGGDVNIVARDGETPAHAVVRGGRRDAEARLGLVLTVPHVDLTLTHRGQTVEQVASACHRPRLVVLVQEAVRTPTNICLAEDASASGWVAPAPTAPPYPLPAM